MNSPKLFATGQRWYSQAEPELGLGIVVEAQDRQVKIFFQAADESRNYSVKTAPLKRHLLVPGDQALSQDNKSFTVETVEERNGIFFYLGGGEVLPETELKSDISLVRPQEKLLAGHFDPPQLYNFRYETLLLRRALQTYQARGLEGARVRLIGHQISIFKDASRSLRLRLALADEVGLGKTIEAGLLVKRLLEKKLAKSVLVFAPLGLQYQWFVEFYKKFELLFKTLGASQGPDEAGDELEFSSDLDNDDFIITTAERWAQDERLRAKEWDVLIVDEAHRMEKGSPAFETLERLALAAKHVLFLSATPEALGEKNFFELLKTLTPEKYRSYEEYLENENHWREQAAQGLSPEQLERYGYERDVFRNRRQNLAKRDQLFPGKRLLALPIKIDRPTDAKVIDAKTQLLAQALQRHPDKKFFVIGKSRKLAIQVQKKLSQTIAVKSALFHGEQSLLERDRQAAYFADPEGAQVLISAESGSEGRNFEFASELFLLDYPAHPQLLLQRIGRLDRIGQKNEVSIHAPFVAYSPEENLFRLYHEVFNLFERFPTGIVEFYESRATEIQDILHSPLSEKMKKLAQEYLAFQEQIESGKNQALDAISYKEENVEAVRAEVANFHRERNLQAYLEKAFNFAGVEIEDIANDCYYIRPSDSMLIPSYPHLPAEGFSYTTSRETAMKREDLRFMNFESPIVAGTMDLFSGGEIGNATAVSVDGALGDNLFLECIFKIEPKQTWYNGINDFFALTPARTLLSASGEDFTAKIPKKRLDSLARPLDPAQSSQLAQGLPKQAVLDLLERAKALARKRSQKYIDQALAQIEAHYGQEIEKLRKWSADNEFSRIELEKLERAKRALIEQAKNLSIELDSMRLVI